MAVFAIILSRSHTVGSRALRGYMWSRWSHSAILDVERDEVWDSTWTHGGVRRWAFAEFQAMQSAIELRFIDVPDAAAARKWLREQEWKPYDKSALFGFLVRRDWADDAAWFCSEFSETFRTLFSRRVFRAAMSRIWPPHQDMIADDFATPAAPCAT